MISDSELRLAMSMHAAWFKWTFLSPDGRHVVAYSRSMDHQPCAMPVVACERVAP